MNFVKHAAASHPQAALVEAAGLRWLKAAEQSGGPAVVTVVSAEAGRLQLEEIRTAGPSAAAAAELGTALARMHRSLPPGTPFGALSPEHPAGQPPLFGPASQPLPVGSGQHTFSWGAFHAQQRLAPILGELKPVLASADWELLDAARARIQRGDFDDAESASLIHGDLWSGNVLWNQQGGVLIDPAAHAGHRESDIAMLELFGLPHLQQVLAAYQQTVPLQPGWHQRLPVHQLFYLAVHWLLFGQSYRSATLNAAQITVEL